MSTLIRRSTLQGLVALVCLLAGVSLSSGCWHRSDLVVQEEGKAFLHVKGNVTGVEVEFDGSGTRQALQQPEGEKMLLLQVLPGRHLVELYRGGERIVTRDLYFGLGQVVEIAVPQ